MSAFIRFLSAFSLMAVLLLNAGCPGGNKKPGDEPRTKEEFWVINFKKELQKTEQRFFEQRFILNQQDPYYLQEILPKLSAEAPLTKAQRTKIDIHREDFDESWPLLSQQLERTQLIFAITAVVPAYQATLLLASVNYTLDAETATMILSFRQSVEKGAIFNSASDSLEIAPKAKQEIVDLGNKIAARILKLLDGAATAGASSAVKSQLSLLRNEIRLLNPEAAEQAGQGLVADEIPFAESPIKLWAELGKVYDSVFRLLADLSKLSEMNGELASSPQPKKAKRLKTEITTLVSDVKMRLAELPSLRTRELELLKKLQFATEKQFSIAKMITKTE